MPETQTSVLITLGIDNMDVLGNGLPTVNICASVDK